MSEHDLVNIQTDLPLDSASAIIDAALAAGDQHSRHVTRLHPQVSTPPRTRTSISLMS